MVVISYSNLPFSDGWTPIAAAARGEKLLSFGYLAQQHNEHRLVIPKLFLAADLRWFHYQQGFLLASILVIQLLHWLLLSWSMRVLGGWHGATWRTGAGAAAFCSFCPAQWENFVWGFQVCFVLPGLFATLSFIGLLLCWTQTKQQAGRRQGWKFLALSILAALGRKLFTWPMEICFGRCWWLRSTPVATFAIREVLSFAVAGAASTVLYFHHYCSPAATCQPDLVISHTSAKSSEYLVLYLGSPGYASTTVRQIFFGIAGSGARAVSGCAFPVLRPRFQRFLGSTDSHPDFLPGNSIHNGAGPGKPRPDAGVLLPIPNRRSSLLVQPGSAGSGGTPIKRTVWAVGVQLLLFAVLVRGATLARFPIRQARWHGFQLNAAAVAVLAGVNDTTQVQLAYPPADYILDILSYMREKRLSVFSAPLASQRGKPLDALFRVVASDSCTGAVQSVTTVGAGESQGLRITGWAWDYENGRPPAEVVATAEGVITGLGAMGDWRPTIRATRPWMNTSFIGFDVYARNRPESAPVQLYAILRGRPPTACYFATK